MIKNYLITALRFLKQNKVFAGINMLGLSIAFEVKRSINKNIILKILKSG